MLSNLRSIKGGRYLLDRSSSKELPEAAFVMRELRRKNLTPVPIEQAKIGNIMDLDYFTIKAVYPSLG